MKEVVSFGPIKEKLEEFVVEGQETGDCEHDCHIAYFVGNDGGIVWHNCTKKWKYTSEYSPYF